MNKSELQATKWLEAHLDRSAGLMTLPRNIVLSDVTGDGDHRLVLADIKFNDTRSRLKVYKGTVLVSDQTLPDIPSGLITFWTESTEPKIPAIGVACNSDLLIYKNNKAYFKFTVPPLPLSSIEENVWRKIKEESHHDINKIVEDLKSEQFNMLSGRSQHLLNLNFEQMEDYIGRFCHSDPVKSTPIVCLGALTKSSHDSAPACPVLATESGQIYILDPQSFSIIHQARVCNVSLTPFLLECDGYFDVEYKILVACREDYVCILKREWIEGKVLFQTTANIVDMKFIQNDNTIMVATVDQMLHCYSKNGSKIWSICLNNRITCICIVPLMYLSASLLAVGLRGGLIYLFKGRQKVDIIQVSDTPSALVFGQLGQEEHVLVVIALDGTINFKILKRTADFNFSKINTNAAPVPQTKPLPLPKRSKLFLEQSQRERQNAIEMHQNFQKDLIRLRLTAARALVQIQSDNSGVGNEKELVKLSAQVLGLGPKFTLILTLENMSNENPLIGLSMLFHCKPTVYKLTKYIVPIPLIPPSLSYKVETKVLEYQFDVKEFEKQESVVTPQVIQVFVIRKEQAQPVLAATINMPPTDLSIPVL